ncbi:hypothetical protein BKA62DRAFT_707599 [Auriculariales sp. MPI-PUGE-AT-0066]|nr:hypothetical protein BKA62DRAFT_707599 [Auriculariales sp. MPI-PUGE-AT-0066]
MPYEWLVGSLNAQIAILSRTRLSRGFTVTLRLLNRTPDYYSSARTSCLHGTERNMPRVRRVLEAANDLSTLLTGVGVQHAFHGGFLAVLLGSTRDTEEICVIVEGSFRPVRDALSASEKWTVNSAPWSARLFATYEHAIPAITFEVKTAGEAGPRKLDETTTMTLHDVPWLTVTEFVRAKLKEWTVRAAPEDAHDLAFALGQFHAHIDLNRIPEPDMTRFVSAVPTCAIAWQAVRARYR